MEESAEERKEREKEERERDLKYWDVLAKAKYDKESSYERLIVYIAAGAISVLIAFIGYKGDSIDKCYIFWGGGALVGALIFALSGIFCSIESHDKVLEGNSDHKNLWGRLANYSFRGAHVLLVAGIIVLSLLIYSNHGVK